MRLVLLLSLLLTSPALAEPAVTFAHFSPAIFTRAQAEKRMVIVDLAAVWCHWCHVMEETTYRDPRVAALIADKFIAVRVDQDADPELSRRYEDYGWPATIIFKADGSELIKRRGYLPPDVFASILEELIADPSPGPSVQPEIPWQASSRARLSPSERRALTKNFLAMYDHTFGGWGHVHKFVDVEPIELALIEPRYRAMAKSTLDHALLLVDPVWGGMYQYSDALDWKSPHYEKIMSLQTQSIEMFVMANNILHDAKHLHAAEAIGDYLLRFLRGSDGAFYVSQDADLSREMPGKLYYARDDAGRRALGMPRIDTHVYARENGWAIAALADLYAATHDDKWLAAAKKAADFVETHHRRSDGGYAHEAGNSAGPFLGDTLAMGEAYARLASVDAAGPWLARATAALDFIDAHFAAAPGYVTARQGATERGERSERKRGSAEPVARPTAPGVLAKPVRLADENVAVARLAARLSRLTKEPRFATIAMRAMNYLTSPTLVETRPFSPGALIADHDVAAIVKN